MASRQFLSVYLVFLLYFLLSSSSVLHLFFQVRWFPINSFPPGHPVPCIFFLQLRLSHILHYTLVQCFSASASSTFFTFYHHVSACCNPIILILTFNLPKICRTT